MVGFVGSLMDVEGFRNARQRESYTQRVDDCVDDCLAWYLM